MGSRLRGNDKIVRAVGEDFNPRVVLKPRHLWDTGTDGTKKLSGAGPLCDAG